MPPRQGTMVNAYQPGKGTLPPEDEARVARRQRLLGPAYRLFYETPLHIVRGEGVWLHDATGRRYLDCYNNVASVGHCHPRVVAAMARQAGQLASHTRYLHDTILDLAERLLATFPPELGPDGGPDGGQVMFTCTGSEANDLATRIARSATGGTGIIVTDNAYHGVTLATAGMSMSIGPAVAPGPDVVAIPAPSPANYPAGVGAGFAAAVTAACATLRARGQRPALLIVDTVFSSDGLWPDPAGFLDPAAKAIRAEGGLFLADEVQPGFGRTGGHMWGFQRHGVIPDMVSLGKPMGNGYPVAGLVARSGVLARFGAEARYFNTFGGNAVAAATALAVLDVIRDEGLMQNAAATGATFAQGLRSLATRHPALGDIRATGLFLAADILNDDGAPCPTTAARVVNGLRERGVLISATGPLGHILKIRPPLPFGPDHAEIFIDTLDSVLAGH